ncbi:MAG: hypothetical protein ABI634_14960 [Acidobacteriota bacterium]
MKTWTIVLALGMAVSITAQSPVPEALRAPTVVPGVERAVDAAIGDHFYVVLRQDGSVMTWGYNNLGQLGNGRVGPTAGSEPGRTLGFVVEGKAQPIDGLSDTVGVAAGSQHGLAVRRDGTVWGWGSNGSAQLALGRSNRGANPLPVQIPGVSNARAVAAYGYASYALLHDGTVLGWGDALWRPGSRAVTSETPVKVPGLTNVVAIRAGLPCLALLADGSVMAWGAGVLGDGSPAQRDYASVVVPQPARVSGLAEVAAIATGASASGVVRRDGSVWVWGGNSLGALGLGKPRTTAEGSDQLAPVKLPTIAGAKDLALASGSTIVLEDGTIRTWGDERLGATGRTGIERVATPTPVPGVTTVVRVWAHAYSNLGLTRDGHVLAWGSMFVGP